MIPFKHLIPVNQRAMDTNPLLPYYLFGQDHQAEVTLAMVEESYQRLLNSKVQIDLTIGEQTTTIDATDPDGQPIRLRDLLGEPKRTDDEPTTAQSIPHSSISAPKSSDGDRHGNDPSS